jgi:hypothetical protein
LVQSVNTSFPNFLCISHFFKSLINLGGRNLLQKYERSLPLLLSSVYPDFQWLPWKFNLTPLEFWTNPENSKKFLEWAKPILNVNKDEDWYNVSNKVKNFFLKLKFFKGYFKFGRTKKNLV